MPNTCQCTSSWNEKLNQYERSAAQVAQNLTALQQAGVRVVWLTLFPRAGTHGGPDPLRGVADHAVQRQLRASGFFDAGGRVMDQYPLYSSYFGLLAERRATLLSKWTMPLGPGLGKAYVDGARQYVDSDDDI